MISSRLQQLIESPSPSHSREIAVNQIPAKFLRDEYIDLPGTSDQPNGTSCIEACETHREKLLDLMLRVLLSIHFAHRHKFDYPLGTTIDWHRIHLFGKRVHPLPERC